jgi:HAD superfamily phosphoserine phosphatase-like hydrolase
MTPKIVFFDCDGVLINYNTWISILAVNKISVTENDLLYKSYYAGKIPYEKLIEIEIGLLRKNFTRQKYLKDIVAKIELNDGAKEIVDYFKNLNIPLAIISSGEETYVKKVAKTLAIENYRVNTYFKFDKNGRFTKMEYHAEDPVAKVNQVKEICKMYNCSPKETFFVGDSNNDLYAFDLTKHGILYKSKDPDCVKHAWKTIEDLREIKNI